MNAINHTLFQEANVEKKTKAFFTHVTGGDYYQIEFSIRAIAERSPKGAVLQISFTDKNQKKIRIKELERFDKLNEFNFVKTIPVISPIVRSTFAFQAPAEADKIRIQLQVNGKYSFNLKAFTLKTISPTSIGVGYFYNNLLPKFVAEFEAGQEDFLKAKLAEAEKLPAAANRALFDIFFAKKDYEQAAFWGEKAYDQTDSFYQVTELLAYTYEQAGNFKKARKFWLKALERGLPNAERNCRRLGVKIDQLETSYSEEAALTLAGNPLEGCSRYHSFAIAECHYYELKLTLPFSEERVASREYFIQYTFYDVNGEEIEQSYSRDLRHSQAGLATHPDEDRTNRSGRFFTPEHSCTVSVFLKEKGLSRSPIAFEIPSLIDLCPNFEVSEFKKLVLKGNYSVADILSDNSEQYLIYTKARILMSLENAGITNEEKVKVAQLLFKQRPDLPIAKFLDKHAEAEGHITLALAAKHYIMENKMSGDKSLSILRLEDQLQLLQNSLDVDSIINDIRSRKDCPDHSEMFSDQEEEKVLYLLHNSLPYHSGGYATRSQGVLEGANSQEGIISPMKPFEAMAVEKLCIVSDCEALTEIITADETGLVFERDNVESLVNELLKSIEQPELRRQLAKAGREWVLENRDWKVVTKVLSAKYKELRNQ